MKRLASAFIMGLVLFWAVVATAQDNPAILFMSDRDGNREIYAMSEDGSDIRRLTNHPAEDTEPAWSPDRRQIAFSSNRDGDFAVFVMNADGTGIRRVTGDVGSFASSPSWSPDGRRLAYVSNASGITQIYTIAQEGTDERQITQGGFESLDPVWSPDGRLIAFAANANGNFEIYVVRPDGTGARQITNDPTVDSDSPAWSPDGTQIAFAANGNSGELYVMDSTGSNLRLLTSVASTFVSNPTWSPDGQQIVYVLREGSLRSIRTITLDGFSVRQITDGTSDVAFPAWASPIPTPGAVSSFIDSDSPIGEGFGFEINMDVQIASLEPEIALRTSPSMRAAIVTAVARSEQAILLEGPQFVAESDRGVPQEFDWWRIRLDSGQEGWIPESMYDEPILVPFSVLDPILPVTCTLRTLQGVNIRSGPGTNFEQIASRRTDNVLAADGQKTGSDGIVWWRLYEGFWVRSDFVRENGDCDALPSVG